MGVEILSYKHNTYDLSGDYGVGYDINGNAFYFDLEDYNKIKNHYWGLQTNGFVDGCIDGKCTSLHRYLLGFPSKEIDHINHNRSDCRKTNLRPCFHEQNCYNMPLQCSNTSGYKGVDFHKKAGKWRARIRVGGRRIELGHFNTALEAHIAYAQASNYFHGEFGCA